MQIGVQYPNGSYHRIDTVSLELAEQWLIEHLPVQASNRDATYHVSIYPTTNAEADQIGQSLLPIELVGLAGLRDALSAHLAKMLGEQPVTVMPGDQAAGQLGGEESADALLEVGEIHGDAGPDRYPGEQLAEVVPGDRGERLPDHQGGIMDRVGTGEPAPVSGVGLAHQAEQIPGVGVVTSAEEQSQLAERRNAAVAPGLRDL